MSCKYKNRKRTKNGYVDIEKEIWEKQTFPEDKFRFVLEKFTRHLSVYFWQILNIVLVSAKTNLKYSKGTV